MLVGMASEISKNCTYKCVDHSRHNGIKGGNHKDRMIKHRVSKKKTKTDVAAMLSVNPAGQVHTMTVSVVSVRRVQECMIL